MPQQNSSPIFSHLAAAQIVDTSKADFQRSNAASARALAKDAALSIDSPDTTTASRLGLILPGFDHTARDQAGKAIARGLGDAIAMVAAHHNTDIHSACQPRGNISRSLFNEMERMRCEAIAAGKYAGMDNNLASLWQQSFPSVGSRTDHNTIQLTRFISYLTREALGLTALPDKPLLDVISTWRDTELVRSTKIWSLLRESIHAQTEYAKLSLLIIKSIETDSLTPGDAEEFTSDVAQSDDEATTHQTDDSDEKDDSEESDTSDDDQDPDGSITVDLRDDNDQQTESIAAESDDADTEEAIMANRDAPVSADSENGHGVGQQAGGGYNVYSSAEDEVVTARNMCTPDELDQLRSALDQQIHRHAKVVGRLSGRLQRVLMSQQQRHWKFDLEEGVLDTTRLTRVVTEPLSALSFKEESDIEFKNTTVTLLVDNSKSMLGKPIAIAAACSDLLSQTLERCGVTVEILGFTTTRLHGGEIFDHWKSNGSASNPGRLNGLRHIIYKSADTPYRSARKNFGLMLMKDLLKQNIDGEALLWAHNRLLKRPEQRKILMVISDGAPIDTSTMSANSQNFLTDHLHQVIGSIEKRGAVELLAIGIGHDVSQYYRRAMKIMDARDLSRSMLAHLSVLFSQAD